MVSDVIAHVKPDVVMVELCAARRDKVLEMARGQRETVLDSLLRTLGVTKEVAAQYVGAGFLTSLDLYLRGNEMLAGIQAAERHRAQVLLGDQDASHTMKRLRDAVSQLSPIDMMRLLQGSVAPNLKDDMAREMYSKLWSVGQSGGEAPLPSREQVDASMRYLRDLLPAPLLRAMLTERDEHMARQLLQSKARRIVG
jgi:pheromone shutdown protein TraB